MVCYHLPRGQLQKMGTARKKSFARIHFSIYHACSKRGRPPVKMGPVYPMAKKNSYQQPFSAFPLQSYQPHMQPQPHHSERMHTHGALGRDPRVYDIDPAHDEESFEEVQAFSSLLKLQRSSPSSSFTDEVDEDWKWLQGIGTSCLFCRLSVSHFLGLFFPFEPAQETVELMQDISKRISNIFIFLPPLPISKAVLIY